MLLEEVIRGAQKGRPGRTGCQFCLSDKGIQRVAFRPSNNECVYGALQILVAMAVSAGISSADFDFGMDRAVSKV